MNTELQNALAAHGWAEVYGRYVQLTGRVNGAGEMRGITPWPDYTHDQDAFVLNVHKGVFDCKRSGRAGTFVTFLAWMEGQEDEESGEFLPADARTIERRLAIEQGVVHPVDPGWLSHCQQALTRVKWETALEPNLRAAGKWWDWQTLVDLGVGWDESEQRFVLPCHDQLGALVNARLYSPNQKPKMKWKHTTGGTSSNFLWPHAAWDESEVILVEGEPDVLTLRSLGYPACSGNLGAGQPVPEGWWFKGKHVTLLFDVDEQGEKAASMAANRLGRDTERLCVAVLPEWGGRPANADISDFVSCCRQHQDASTASQEAICAAVGGILGQAREVAKADAPAPLEDAAEVSFTAGRDPSHAGKRIEFGAQILGLSKHLYRMPTVSHCRCPARGHRYCAACPMKKAGGEMTVTHRSTDANALKLIAIDAERQGEAIKEQIGVTRICPDFRHEGRRFVNIREAALGPRLEEESGFSEQNAAYVIVNEGDPLEATEEYLVSGFMHPHPKNQVGVHLIDHYDRAVSPVSAFVLTPEIVDDLRQFQCRTGQPVYEKLCDVAQDLADSVTGIRGRADLHLAYRSVWYSSLTFTCGNEKIDRGWLECLVVGDTRCGKSQAFKKMAELLRLGTWVDCKNQSVAGILGTSQKMHSGEWYVAPGIMPQNDGKIVAFDEFNADLDRDCVIKFMASARSDGVVVISKAGGARFRARVRSIWLSNPGQRRLLSEIGRMGVELIPRLIQQPEDIARFDFALIVAQEDVDTDLIQNTDGLSTPRYSASGHQNLLLWAWSRTEEEKRFTKEAAAEVVRVARAMVEQYSDQVPLVERNEQRKRVAKLSISIAAQCFSCEEEGRVMVVTAEHVRAAETLFHLWYDKPAMSYDLYSQKVATSHAIKDETVVRKILDQHLGDHLLIGLEQVLRLREFTERTFAMAVGRDEMLGRAIVSALCYHDVIRAVDGGRSPRFELSPAGTRWMRALLDELEKEVEATP